MYVVAQGTVELSSISKKEENLGCSTVFATITSGQYFGELALAVKMPRSATATTREKTLLLLLEKQDLMRFLASSPELQLAFNKQASGK